MYFLVSRPSCTLVSFFISYTRTLALPERGELPNSASLDACLLRRGIEVILDVVFNHTAEGNENGPTLSFRCV
jgi:hypothetical protein